jgi:chromosome segregation ATPase
MAHERQADAEARIRAAMQQLLAETTPDGLKCDVKSLCALSGVPRATLYRTYPHLKAEFERQRTAAQHAGRQPDPRLAQIDRLKDEVAKLRERLSKKDAELDALTAFRAEALSRLAAQHDEITALRQQLEAGPEATVRMLPIR